MEPINVGDGSQSSRPVQTSATQPAHTSQFNAFQREALDVQPALAQFRRIANSASRVSLNAEIGAAKLGAQGAAYGIVAREIAEIVQQLTGLLAELESSFRKIALHAVGSMRGEERAAKLANARARMSPERAPDGPDDRAALRELLARLMGQEQAEVRTARRQALELTRRLELYVNRIARVAGRQSHFAAVTAAVESSRLSGTGDLAAVTELFRQLADDIANTERNARDAILDLMGRASYLSRTLE